MSVVACRATSLLILFADRVECAAVFYRHGVPRGTNVVRWGGVFVVPRGTFCCLPSAVYCDSVVLSCKIYQ